MLPYLFAIAIALASLSLFVTAFFSPKWHRKDDFLWSGVGLIYTLVLWICAEQIRGSVLLGQGAATVLVLSLIWQTVQLRKLLAISDKSTELTVLSFTSAVQGLFTQKKKGITAQPTVGGANVPAPASIRPNVEPVESAIATAKEKLSDRVEAIGDVPVIKELTETVGEAANFDGNIDNINLEKTVEEVISTDIPPKRNPPLPTVAEKFSPISVQPATPKPRKSGFSLTSLFGRGKPKTDNLPNLKPEALTELLDRQDEEINAQNDADWDDVFESLAPETQIEGIQESVTEAISPVQEQVEGVVAEVTEAIVPETQIEEIKDAVTEAIAPLQEQVEALAEQVSEVMEQKPAVTEAIADLADGVETEGSAFLDQIKEEAEATIAGFESENKNS